MFALKAIKERGELQTAPNHLPIAPKQSKVGHEGTEEAWRLARGSVLMVDGEDGKREAGSEVRTEDTDSGGWFRWANGRSVNTGRHVQPACLEMHRGLPDGEEVTPRGRRLESGNPFFPAH